MASNSVPDSQAVPSNIVCICGATFKSRKRLGTVQCSTCNMWSHLACYNLSKEEADMESYVFICITAVLLFHLFLSASALMALPVSLVSVILLNLLLSLILS